MSAPSMPIRRPGGIVATAALAAFVAGAAFAGQTPQLTLLSSAFTQGSPIPQRYTCRGQNESPPVMWNNVPPDAVSLALIVFDPDAPHGTFVHWLIYNLPAAADHLPGAMSRDATTARSAEQGTNSFGRVGYDGPCPPSGPPHHYHLRLYALNARLALKPRATAPELKAAMRGHVLASYDLVGTFGL